MNHKRFAKTVDRSDMFYWQGDRPFTAKETLKIFLDRHQKFNRKLTAKAIEYGMQQAGKSKDGAKVVQVTDPIPSGSVNIVSQAKLKDGTKVVIRMHPSGIKNGYFWAESVAAQKAKDIGVPCFTTYFIDDTQKKFDFDYMIMECLPGKNIKKDLWPLSKDLEKKLAEQTGFYTAEINSIKTEKYGFFDNKVAKKEKRLVGIHNQWHGHLNAAFKKNINYLSKHKTLTSQKRETLERIYFNGLKTNKYTDPRLVHNDVADWNQVAVKDKVTGMLDWDECFSGDPIMDIAAYGLFFSGDKMKYFLKGYEKFTPLPGDFEERVHLYRVRYLVAKLAMRVKKLLLRQDEFYQELIDHGMKTLKEELAWYGR